ncbi:MAG TPA: polymer-forming cytoskeletal protein [Gemmatimonadaceae bacterium]|nr:polymer-forming cytoskeletal protein [Gemmatimonadaceae bacterium]
MSLFNKPPNERPFVRPEPPPPDATPSVIGVGMKIIGDVETGGVLKVEGTIEGSIRGARQVLLGRTGLIQGDVNVDEAVLGGRVVGTVNASERVEIQSTSRIEGDIHTRSIVVLEGGVINGSVRMDEHPVRSHAASTAASSSASPAPASPQSSQAPAQPRSPVGATS